MSQFWIVAVLVLWVLMIALSVTVLGLLRRIGPALERAELVLQARPLTTGGAPPGSAVPPFAVADADGSTVTSTELFSTSALVLFMSFACDPCRSLAAEMSEVGEAIEGVPLFIVMEETDEAARFPLPRSARVLYQIDHSASKAFENISTPQVFLTENGGTVIDLLIPGSFDAIRDLVLEHVKGGDRQAVRRQEASV